MVAFHYRLCHARSTAGRMGDYNGMLQSTNAERLARCKVNNLKTWSTRSNRAIKCTPVPGLSLQPWCKPLHDQKIIHKSLEILIMDILITSFCLLNISPSNGLVNYLCVQKGWRQTSRLCGDSNSQRSPFV